MRPNNPLRIGIIGATGRLGKAIASMAIRNPSFQIVAALTHVNSPHLQKDLGSFLGISPLNLPITTTPHEVDLFLDVSLASAFSSNLSLALKAKKPLVIGTTGLSEKDFSRLQEASCEIPLFYPANFSIGMALLNKFAAEMSRHFHPDAQIDLIETHHIQKKDAPGGSALTLASTIRKAHPKGVTPHIHSIRSGQIVGEHELLFNTAEERLTLSHQSHTRDTYARGALAAASFLAQQPPGLYSMEQLLNIKF